MKNLIKFSKTPLAIISSVIFVAFMVVLMVVCLMPHGSTYTLTSTKEYAGQQYTTTATYNFKDADTLEMVTETKDKDGKVIEELGGKLEIKYEVKDGKLFAGATKETMVEAAEINAFEIKGKLSGDDEITSMKCNTNYVLRDLSIAFMCVGGVLLAASIVVIVLDKKGIIK